MEKNHLDKISYNLIFNLPKSIKFLRSFSISSDQRNNFHCLKAISILDKVNMTKLSKFTGYTKSNLTPIIDSLVKQGFLERKSDENDRRVVYLVMTEAGSKYLEECLEEFQTFISNKLKKLTGSELVTLENSLNNVINILKNIDES